MTRLLTASALLLVAACGRIGYDRHVVPSDAGQLDSSVLDSGLQDASGGDSGLVICGDQLCAVEETGANCAMDCGLNPYSTRLELTENPMSEGSAWVTGKAIGLVWNDPRTTPRKAFASVLSGLGGSRDDDSIAHLSASFSRFAANQWAQATVFRTAGYSPTGHDVALLLRFSITANDAHGYEVLWDATGNLAIVRWNGPLGDLTPLLGSVALGAPEEGDVLRAEIRGDVITVYENGVMVATGPADATWASGQPGIALRPVDASSPADFGWKTFVAGDL